MRLQRTVPTQSESSAAASARVSIGGAAPAVLLDSERRSVQIPAPAGIIRLPKAGEEQLAIKTEDGTALLGLIGQEVPDDLSAGDILIKSGDAAICLRSDGRVEITGRLFINGSEQNGT